MRELVLNFFSFAGRVDRRHFILGSLISCIVLVWAIYGAPLPLGFLLPGAVAVALRYLLFSLAKVAGTATLASFHVRRLHDQGASGWWTLAVTIWYGAWSYILFRIGVRCHPIIATTLVPLPVWVLLFLPGSKGDNRYGPDPRNKN